MKNLSKVKILSKLTIYKGYTIRAAKSSYYVYTQSGYGLFKRLALKDAKASIDLI